MEEAQKGAVGEEDAVVKVAWGGVTNSVEVAVV